MDARAVLTRLRQGVPLRDDEVQWFARGLASGVVSDAQAAAFAMGVCKSGMTEPETVALTRAMRDSGKVLEWDLPGPVLDKHSTGGLGDATSLVVAPVLAALGCYAPFLSGRGLGHTGGTLDKLEALDGVVTTVSESRLRAIVEDVGCAVVSATNEIAPADRRLYAIRDETGTVDSPALITASILSKKLATGAHALVLDVKVGTGAFMQTRAQAKALAQALVNTARGAGCPTQALITDMNQPLAPAIGNALELIEVLHVLRDPKPDNRLCTLSLALCGEVLALARRFATPQEGARAALGVLQDGSAAEKFAAMIHALKGPARLLDNPEAYLRRAPVRAKVAADRDGYVAAINGTALGQAVVRLGGGRLRSDDVIDPRVGLADIRSLGAKVRFGAPLAVVYAATEGDAARAVEEVRRAIEVSEDAPTAQPLIQGRID